MLKYLLCLFNFHILPQYIIYLVLFAETVEANTFRSVFSLFSQQRSSLFRHISQSVDFVFIFQKQGSNDLIVEQLGSSKSWMEQPNIKGSLEDVIEWNEPKHIEENIIEYSEKGINHPISQPLGIIIANRTFDCLERHISWVNKTDEGSD